MSSEDIEELKEGDPEYGKVYLAVASRSCRASGMLTALLSDGEDEMYAGLTISFKVHESYPAYVNPQEEVITIFVPNPRDWISEIMDAMDS